MALTKKQEAMIDSCPVLKALKSELVEALGGSSNGTSNSNSNSANANPSGGTPAPMTDAEGD